MGGDTFQLPPAAGGTPTAQAKALLTLCTRWLGVESGRPTSPLGRLCCASPALAPGEEEGIAGEAPRKRREPFPHPPKSAGCQHQPQHLGPPRARGRRQSPARWLPRIYVPRRALGNVPGAVPPHLPQHELMHSAGLGFTLALPPPAAAFRSHPEGRSLAVLRRPPGRPPGAPALFAPSTWFLSPHFLEV